MPLSVDQMREVDRLMTEELGIQLPQMMENADRALAQHTRHLLGGDPRGRRVVILAGRGGNGGGGMAAARRLSIWGAEVSLVLALPRDDLHGVLALQLGIVERLGLPVHPPDTFPRDLLDRADVLIDALIGYSLQGAPRGAVAELIDAANNSDSPTVALDIPSGMHGDSGRAYSPTIRAQTTLTLALLKRGLVEPNAREWVGDLYLADISVPALVYQRLGLKVGPIVAQSDTVRVDPASHGG